MKKFLSIHAKMKKITLLFLLSFSYTIAGAQTYLSGQIFSAKDSTTLGGSSIYFDGTSIGVSADLDGKFRIKKDEGTTSHLIISSIGYHTRIITDHAGLEGKLLKIYLTESTEQLDEVYLEEDTWSRKKKLDYFRREFLGNTIEATKCRIKNEEAIRLIYVPSKDMLLAHAEEPIKVVNRHLGYEVDYNLENFKIEFSTGESGLRLVKLVYYEGYSFFEETSPLPKKKILRNREKAYKGSSLHFMRALSKKALRENGFKIFHEKFEVPPYEHIKVAQGPLTEVVFITEQLSILYNNFDQSLIRADGKFYIDQWGNHTPPVMVLFGGDMGISRIARTLPVNFGME